MVQFLIERGADIHSKERRGWGVLHLAARCPSSTIPYTLARNHTIP